LGALIFAIPAPPAAGVSPPFPLGLRVDRSRSTLPELVTRVRTARRGLATPLCPSREGPLRWASEGVPNGNSGRWYPERDPRRQPLRPGRDVGGKNSNVPKYPSHGRSRRKRRVLTRTCPQARGGAASDHALDRSRHVGISCSETLTRACPPSQWCRR
jgi:hypothetical protein